jgi:Dyp-type peroxidase family
MTLKQHPPFLICVPIAHSAGWPGLAAREVDALLGRLGNPAGPAMKDALDASRIVHFLSMSVMWDEDSGDPPVLIVDVTADGSPKTIIAALVEHAGALLLPIFEAATGVASLPALQALLDRSWIKPVAASLPLWPHRVTGLAFQGTPDLTVDRIKRDACIGKESREVVLGAAPGRPPALSLLQAARRATGITPRSQPSPRPLIFMTSLRAPSGSRNPAWSISSVLILDWSFSFVMLLAAISLNMLFLSGPILDSRNEYGNFISLYIPILIVTSGIFSVVTKPIGGLVKWRRLYKPKYWVAVLIIAVVVVAIALALYVSIRASKITGADSLITDIVAAFVIPSVAGAVGLLSLVLFLALVGGVVVFILWRHETADKPCDADPDPTILADMMRQENPPSHKQNHMISVSQISPGPFRRFVSLPAGLYAASLTVRAGLFRTGFLAGIGTIHSIQWARIPHTGKLVFTANYDGSWQSYLEDAITLLPTGANAIWSNTKGYPKTRWLFFDGAKDGDRFKRWVRRQMIPSRFWYSAYPHLTTTHIRANAAIRCGLEAADITPSEAEAWVRLFGSDPRPASDIETDQIQGLILVGYRNLLESVTLALTLPENEKACRRWLADVGARVDFGEAGQRDSAMAVALSASGLERLGLDATGPLAARFSPAFAMGMTNAARTNVLGDFGANAPDKWEWGTPAKPVHAVLLIYAKDGQTLKARLQDERAKCQRAGIVPAREINLRRWPSPRGPITEPFGFVDGISQPAIRGSLSSRGALAADLLEPGEFILGYPDGRERFPPTPQVFAATDPAALLPDLPLDFPGQPGKKPVRDLGRNGSYLVIRQLKQDVAGFRAYVAGAAAPGDPPDMVAAKMMGRWPNGAPLVLFPHGQPRTYDPIKKDEDFLFGRDDPQGLACPFGAHIRRANPRDQFDPGDKTQVSITNRHRIIRRGRSYVDGVDSSADAQGLMFMCLNADIERQFEFLQQTWLGSSSFGPLDAEADPIMAHNRRNGTYTIPTVDAPRQLTAMPSFVSVIGGGYFFLPGRQALKFLSR